MEETWRLPSNVEYPELDIQEPQQQPSDSELEMREIVDMLISEWNNRKITGRDMYLSNYVGVLQKLNLLQQTECVKQMQISLSRIIEILTKGKIEEEKEEKEEEEEKEEKEEEKKTFNRPHLAKYTMFIVQQDSSSSKLNNLSTSDYFTPKYVPLKRIYEKKK